MEWEEEGGSAQEYNEQKETHHETSPLALLEHWMPAKESEGREQRVAEVEKVQLFSLMSVISLQKKLLRSRWLMTLLDILQE